MQEQLKYPSPESLTVLPCAADGRCQECAVFHEPEMPHNNQSLFYQYKFYSEQRRWPTWKDAMAHCSDEMKAHWTRELIKAGQVIE